MKSDAYIKHTGFLALKNSLGSVGMERFIMLINREKKDYTIWRKELFEDMSIEELAEKAEKYSNDN